MSGGATLEHIDAVDAFAKTLFLRTKQCSSPIFTDVAAAVRHLHLALRHLRVEVADGDSLLRSADASVYARQLRPIVEDCDFALKQLETILGKYDAAGGREADALLDRLDAVRSRLVGETTSVDMFLDTVQLHNRANNAPEAVVSQGSQSNLESIKDKVDNIAKRLFSRRDTSGEIIDDEDRMWQEFKSELEIEGFSPQVLRQHKDILRAYIRELQSMSTRNGGAPPTVRGLLEQEARAGPPPIPPKEPLSPKERYSNEDNEKCMPSMKAERRLPDHGPPMAVGHVVEDRSFSSDDGTSSDTSDSMALISTKDILAMDSINSGMAGLHLHPGFANFGGSPLRNNQGLLLPNMASTWPPPPMVAELSSSANSLSTSPRSAYQNQGYSTSPNGSQPGMYGSSPRNVSRLAPDRYGKDIPMEAPWTKIRRSLVSPEVLERAGVRYEARPEFVAILGRLTREEIADFARQSADCRAARAGRYPPPRYPDRYYRPQQNHHNQHHWRDRADSKSSRDENDDGSVLWDESDTTDYDDDKISDKGTKSYPYIVHPPSRAKTKTSPASTVMPKPILKNKNENHVRFDPEPHEVDIKTPKSYDANYDHGRRRENGSRRRDRDRDYHRGDRYHSDDGDRNRHANRGERDRRRERREDRQIKKKSWGETIGAVSIGGAAASLLGVLTEAAVGF